MVHLLIKKFLPDSLNYQVIGVFTSLHVAVRLRNKYFRRNNAHVLDTGLSIINLPINKILDF